MALVYGILKEEDIPQLNEILYEFMESPLQVRKFLSEKQNIALVAKLDNKVIGLIYGYSLTRMDAKLPQFFMYSVDIHPAYQDKGYGSQFIQYSVDWAKDNGYSESFVITDEGNPRACRVYKKAGMKHNENDVTRMYEIHYT